MKSWIATCLLLASSLCSMAAAAAGTLDEV